MKMRPFLYGFQKKIGENLSKVSKALKTAGDHLSKAGHFMVEEFKMSQQRAAEHSYARLWLWLTVVNFELQIQFQFTYNY